MGLFDKIKDAAGDAVDGAKEKMGDFDASKGLDIAGSAIEGSKSMLEAADSFGEAKDKLVGE